MGIYMLHKHAKVVLHYSNPSLFIIKWNNLQNEIYVTKLMQMTYSLIEL
jgi:hypothetical protein